MPMVVAGRCSEPLEKEYYRTHIAPRLGPDVTIFGTADAAAKRDLLSRAAALVFPILWDEPFGMVMIEAMACGTPVVALRRGSVPEVVVDGVTGFACADEAAMALDPVACRAHAAARFDRSVIARCHAALFARVIADTRGRESATEREDPTGSARLVPVG